MYHKKARLSCMDAATIEELVDITPHPAREGWYEAYCWDCQWATKGSEPAVEDAEYEHVWRKHRDEPVKSWWVLTVNRRQNRACLRKWPTRPGLPIYDTHQRALEVSRKKVAGWRKRGLMRDAS